MERCRGMKEDQEGGGGIKGQWLTGERWVEGDDNG